MRFAMALCTTLTLCGLTHAHDTWVETNTPFIRVGDVLHVDLKLGNHGNEHRDFKLASKITLAPCRLQIVSSTGVAFDLKERLVDTGYAPKEGYWSARFVPTERGLHVVAHTLDTLHGKIRAIKSGKAYFVAAPEWKLPVDALKGFDKPLGHALEIVPLTDPVTDSEPGRALLVRVHFEDKPLANARVTFIPRGQVLADGLDAEFERTTAADGIAEFTPRDGNVVLVIVHHALPERSGEGYSSTHFAASLTVAVPQQPLVSASTPISPGK